MRRKHESVAVHFLTNRANAHTEHASFYHGDGWRRKNHDAQLCFRDGGPWAAGSDTVPINAELARPTFSNDLTLSVTDAKECARCAYLLVGNNDVSPFEETARSGTKASSGLKGQRRFFLWRGRGRGWIDASFRQAQ